MTHKQKALHLAAQWGITIFKSDAPPQSIITGTDCHYIICFGWDDVSQRISLGIEPCEDTECVCREESIRTPEEYAQWMNWELIYKGQW